MNQSEEMRLLPARIAQLERQQTINSTTPSSVGGIEEQERLVGKTLEQMEEWKRITKLELENKAFAPNWNIKNC
uniref:Uncharacterized protein n=1 Tax=Globodera rostochiensis TaxID=31243 RepID=A0A914I9Q2_GLORO